MIGAADVRGLVHITGGGFPENIPRVVPKGLAARIRRSAWEVPPLFQWVQEVSRGRGGRGWPDWLRPGQCVRHGGCTPVSALATLQHLPPGAALSAARAWLCRALPPPPDPLP